MASQALSEIVLNKFELAEKLQVSIKTIERWSRAEKIPCLRVGRTIRYEWAAVKAALSQPTANVLKSDVIS
jgi:excisionase family DNA binding protein